MCAIFKVVSVHTIEFVHLKRPMHCFNKWDQDLYIHIYSVIVLTGTMFLCIYVFVI